MKNDQKLRNLNGSFRMSYKMGYNCLTLFFIPPKSRFCSGHSSAWNIFDPTQPCSFWQFQTFLVKIAVFSFCIEFSNVSILIFEKSLWRLKYFKSTCYIQILVYCEYVFTARQCSLVKFYLKFCYKHFITCDNTHFNFGFCWVTSSWAGDTVQSVLKDFSSIFASNRPLKSRIRFKLHDPKIRTWTVLYKTGQSKKTWSARSAKVDFKGRPKRTVYFGPDFLHLLILTPVDLIPLNRSSSRGWSIPNENTSMIYEVVRVHSSPLASLDDRYSRVSRDAIDFERWLEFPVQENPNIWKSNF